MRRIAIGLAVAAAVLGGVLGALALRMPAGEIERQLLASLSGGSGLGVTARGEPSLALFPPRLRLEGVTVADAAGAAIMTARAVVATPRLKALLAGRVEIDQLRLQSPEITADGLDIDALAATLIRRGEDRSRLPTLRIEDGAVVWGRRRVDRIEAGVVWPRVGRSLSLTGVGRFRGRNVEIAASAADLVAVARGERGAVKLRLAGGGGKLAFDGFAARDTDGRRLEGALGVRAGSLKDVALWFGAVAPAFGAPLADVTLSGRATVDRSGIAVAAAEIALDGANFVGGVRFALESGRPQIEATLDARAVDVTAYVDGFAPMLGGDGWSAAPLDVRPFRAVDLDLRLSAQSVTAGPLRFGPTAATITVANGALDVGIGEAAAYGGSLSGRIVVAPGGRTAMVRLQAQAADLDVGQALAAATGTAPLSGALTGDIALEGRGATVADIVADLSGRGSARLAGGEIGGFRSKALALMGLGGRLELRGAEATLTIADGVALTDDLVLDGPEARLKLAGEANLVLRRLAMAGVLGVGSGEGFSAPVRVEGPFAQPKLRLGARPRERRSAAPSAAPAFPVP